MLACNGYVVRGKFGRFQKRDCSSAQIQKPVAKTCAATVSRYTRNGVTEGFSATLMNPSILIGHDCVIKNAVDFILAPLRSPSLGFLNRSFIEPVRRMKPSFYKNEPEQPLRPWRS
jgi:hypothetical protein